MEAATKDNDIEMARGTSAAETMMASSSNNQGKSFNSMGLENYSAAAEGDFEKFKHSDSEALAKLLTPNDNTILHIHITARSPPESSTGQENKTVKLPEGDFVRRVLGKCSDLLWKVNKKGETLLHMAARHGHADVAKFLLEECKNNQNDTRRMLQMTNEARDTALHEAVRYSDDDLDVVKVLTEADPELTYEANTAGETPLYLAAERGYAEVLNVILTTCSSPGDHGPYDRTALHVAVIHEDEDMVEKLLQAREGIHEIKQDQHGLTPLHFAAHLGNIKILNKLLSKDNSAAYKADKEGKTALHVAAGHGRVGIMRELISKCPDCCELVDERGWNVLHFAFESRNEKAVKLVLKHPWLRNLINEKDENGNTPFLLAASITYCNLDDPRAEMRDFNHYRVDMRVFNNHNHNAADIVSANEPISNKPIFVERLPDLFLWVLEKYKVKRGLRSENINIGERKDEGNTVKSKSKEDGGVEDEGNRMSSKSNNVKGKNTSIDNLMKKTKQSELVVATLIATVTFAAGFTVPGGFVADKGPDQGAAILTRNMAFKVFVMLNTLSMILSSFSVFNHFALSSVTRVLNTRELFKHMRLGQVLISYAMMAMIGAFLSGTYAVLHSDIKLAINACVGPVGVYAGFKLCNNIEYLRLFRWMMIQKMVEIMYTFFGLCNNIESLKLFGWKMKQKMDNFIYKI